MALQGFLGPAGICEHCPIMCRALWDLPESVILSLYVQGFVGPAGISPLVLSDGVRGRSFLQVTNAITFFTSEIYGTRNKTRGA